VPGLLAGQIGEAAVIKRLAAARLIAWKTDLMSQPPQQAHQGHACLGAKAIAQAGDHEVDFHPTKWRVVSGQ
jgi:hypothetical protein